MLEIIALIFVSKEIGSLAATKGLKPGFWKFYMIIAWISGEMLGVIIGFMMFQKDNLISIMLIGIAGGITGYFLIKNTLLKKPDHWDEDIEHIGDT